MSNTPVIRNPTLIYRRLWIVVVPAALIAGFVAVRQASNTVVLGSTWKESGQFPIDQFDHRPLTDLLGKYVDDSGRVDYESWRQNAEDCLALRNYLQSASRIRWDDHRSPRTLVDDPQTHEKAFWINAYNALTIHAVLNIYPTDSIRQHTNPIGFNIWNHFRLMVGSRAWSLTEIENGPLGDLQDPRVHFAIVKASESCPSLRQEAYHPANIDQQLDTVANAFLTNQSNVRTEGTQRVHLNPVIKPVLTGFGGNQADQLRKLSDLVQEAEIRDFLQTRQPRILWMKHDWSLNKK